MKTRLNINELHVSDLLDPRSRLEVRFVPDYFVGTRLVNNK